MHKKSKTRSIRQQIALSDIVCLLIKLGFNYFWFFNFFFLYGLLNFYSLKLLIFMNQYRNRNRNRKNHKEADSCIRKDVQRVDTH